MTGSRHCLRAVAGALCAAALVLAAPPLAGAQGPESGAPARQGVPPGSPEGGPGAEGMIPAAPQVINLSLMDALVAVGATDLAGVFSFIPEMQSSMALADYLMHNRKALTKFIKKGEKDLKEVQGINEWDKQVFLFLIGINAQPRLPAGIERIPEKLMKQVNRMGLAQPLPLRIIVERRAANK
ncbi:MAG: hypothetical protein ABII00_04205 [Elusimicrobiota bacterium]